MTSPESHDANLLINNYNTAVSGVAGQEILPRNAIGAVSLGIYAAKQKSPARRGFFDSASA